MFFDVQLQRMVNNNSLIGLSVTEAEKRLKPKAVFDCKHRGWDYCFYFFRGPMNVTYLQMRVLDGRISEVAVRMN